MFKYWGGWVLTAHQPSSSHLFRRYAQGDRHNMDGRAHRQKRHRRARQAREPRLHQRQRGGVPGLSPEGGGFQFCTLSAEPLFTPQGQIRDDVTFAQLAEFVWFAETGTGYSGKADSPLLGMHEGRAIYLLYEGILKDKAVDGGNVLTAAVFAILPTFDGPKTIYAAACRLGAPRLQREQIAFKQTPYALAV